METRQTYTINEFDAQGLKQIMHDVSQEPAKGLVKFQVTTSWEGGMRSATHVESYELAGRTIPRDFTIPCDEPLEFLGTNTAANPQELLMSAFNACMLAAYVCGASLKGLQLEKLQIETNGQLDLRGFLGLDESIEPGYDEMNYTVRIKGNGTTEQFRKIHETVMATSPNHWNIANPIKLNSRLVIE